MEIKNIKTIKGLFFTCACATLLIFANCGGGDDPVAEEPTLTAAAANALLLDKDWSLSSATNAGTTRDEWTGTFFFLSFWTFLENVKKQRTYVV